MTQPRQTTSGITITMVDVERHLLDEIANKRMKRDDVALTYAFGLRDCVNEVDWARVNRTIIDRWSFSGLKHIKTWAWRHVEGRALTQPGQNDFNWIWLRMARKNPARPEIVPGQLVCRRLLGVESTYRVIDENDRGVEVEVVEAPGLKPGSRFTFLHVDVAAMERSPVPGSARLRSQRQAPLRSRIV